MHYPVNPVRQPRTTLRDVSGQELNANQVLNAIRHTGSTTPRATIPSSHHPAVMRSAKGGRS